jgi:monoamine oxidase
MERTGGRKKMKKRGERRVTKEAQRQSASKQKTPHVVIVGAGFGGLTAAKALRRAPVQITACPHA